MSDALRIENLSVSFGAREVLHNITLRCPHNSVTVLIGRSGSGKSTLLRAVNRLNEEFPACRTTGNIFADMGDGLRPIYPVENTQVTKITAAPASLADTAPPAATGTAPLSGTGAASLSETGAAPLATPLPLPLLRQHAGMLFQTPDVFPVSVEKNITLPLESVQGLPRREAQERAAHALRMAGLWDEVHDHLRQPAETLSGGQKQRLCLARVLALQPRLLLLDEPTASLDVHAARRVESVLRTLAGTLPILMVSHNLAQAKRMADRIILMEQGRVIREIPTPHNVSEAQLTEWMCLE